MSDKAKTEDIYVIAIDFDGTLCTLAPWPKIGAPHKAVIDKAKLAQCDGKKLVLWTCRTGEELDKAVQWCAAFGLYFNAVNENLPELIEHFGGDTRKIFANEYWDDRAVPFASLLK